VFEFLFNHPAAVFRKGEFVFASGWPVWLLLALIAASGAGLLWNLFRNRHRHSTRRLFILWGFQFAAAALILFMLWQPAVAIQSLRPQQNIVAVLVDTSGSMTLDEDGTSRFQKVRESVEGEFLDQLRSKFRVRLYSFARDLKRIQSLDEAPPPGDSTRLGESLAELLRESSSLPLGAVVVFSDGSDNSGGFDRELAAEIRRRNVPVHAVGAGRTEMPDDVELADVSVAGRALPKSTLSARVTIRHAGAGGTTRLRVRDGSRILASKEIGLERGKRMQTESVSFNVGDGGLRNLRFELEELPGERIAGNNAQSRVVEVPQQRRRILYIEGQPRWEYKFMRRAVHDDPAVELVSMLRTTPNKFYRQGVKEASELADGFPSEPEDLFRYHALIIGGIEAAFFTPRQQELIREFVSRRGGALLMLAGKKGLADGGWDASRVADVLPARLPDGRGPTFVREKAPVELTVQGGDSLICRLAEDPAENRKQWQGLPEVADYQRIGELKPAAVALLNVVLENGEQPLLVSQSYGRGKAMIFATGGTWRWQMGLPHEDARHETFWQQLLRALAANSPAPVSLTSDRELYADDPRVRLRAEVRNKSYQLASNARVLAAVISESGREKTVELRPSADEAGVYEGEALAPEPGAYRVEARAYLGDEPLGSEALHFRREDGIAEAFRPQQNRELLERLAEQTGGRYWTLDELPGLPKEVRFSEAGINSREIMDLWDMPALFFLLLALRGGEWLLRRRWGTV